MKNLLNVLLLINPIVLLAQHSIGISLGSNSGNVIYKSETVSYKLTGIPTANSSFMYQWYILNRNGEANYEPVICIETGYLPIKIRDINTHLLTTWSLDYATAKITYKHVGKFRKRLSHEFGAGFSGNIMISGVQQRGFEQYNLRKKVNPIIMSIHSQLGANYFISKESYTNLSVEFNYGLSNLENDPQQTARLQYWKISLALYFNL